MKKFLWFFLPATLLFFFQFMQAGLANAATFTVDTTSDTVDASPGNGSCADSTGACSLRAAIEEANALAGADNINLPIGTYALTISELQITGDLTINGTDVGSTVINGSNQYRVFSIPYQVPSYVVSISGVTITGGYLGCADGGGIYNRGNLTITDSLVSDNIANRCGSTGGNAGGIYSDGMLTLINSTVSGNKSAGLSAGGGIWNNGGTLTITNSTISNNSTGTPWSQGEVQGHGGGIYNSGPLSITNSTIRGNFSINGGGIRHDNGELTIINSTINNNTAYYLSGILTGHGGGIFAVSGTVDVVSSIISNNRAYWSSVGGESAAGLYNSGATVTIVNSTISGNDGTYLTGGINNLSGTLTITNSTISGNTAINGGTGGIRRSGGTLSLSNTIVANQVTGPDCYGTITSIGYNLDSDGSCGLTQTGDLSAGSANLRPLTDNGGPTMTHALGAGSDAVDAGDETVCANAPVNGSDQRGSRRSDGACDIGAFETIPGDVNIDGSVNLLDTILSLQAVSGMETPETDPIADINGDSRIGLDEAINALQVTSEIRTPPDNAFLSIRRTGIGEIKGVQP